MIQSLSTEKAKEKEKLMPPPPLKPNPTYGAVGDRGILLDVGITLTGRRTRIYAHPCNPINPVRYNYTYLHEKLWTPTVFFTKSLLMVSKTSSQYSHIKQYNTRLETDLMHVKWVS